MIVLNSKHLERTKYAVRSGCTHFLKCGSKIEEYHFKQPNTVIDQTAKVKWISKIEVDHFKQPNVTLGQVLNTELCLCNFQTHANYAIKSQCTFLLIKVMLFLVMLLL